MSNVLHCVGVGVWVGVHVWECVGVGVGVGVWVGVHVGECVGGCA